jgi:predicted ATPase
LTPSSTGSSVIGSSRQTFGKTSSSELMAFHYSLEEMTKAVVEADGQRAAERTAAAIPSSAVAVPATLQALLMARLDRLGGPAKEVAQIGAAIGREFSYALLAAVARRPEADLGLALDRLVTAGLMFRQGSPAVCALWRTEIAQSCVRFGGEAF